MKTRVTMADVARAVGVNKGTVSRALRGDRRISAETCKRIWDAARELGYEVDAVASGLSSKRTGTVAVVVECMDTPWTGAFLSAVSAVLARFKTEMLIFEAGGASAVANVFRRIESRKADGLIWAGSSDLRSFNADMPVVRVGAQPDGALSCVWLDEKGILERVRGLAAGRPVEFHVGEGGPMSFLAALANEPGVGRPFVIYDGVCNYPHDAAPDLLCVDERSARLLRVPCLRLPSRELGTLSARVLMNFVRELGARPPKVLVRPQLISASGDLILPEVIDRQDKTV